MQEKLTIRQSYLSLFLKSPSDFLKRWNDKGFKPNENMLFGTKMHAEKEKENGEFGERKFIIDMGICNLSGTLDYYDGELIKDYKYTGKVDSWEGYKNQIAVYQYLVWKKDKLLVPAILEMIEVARNPFAEPEFSLTGVVKPFNFKKPTVADITKFEKKVVSSLKQMIYLMQPKPTRPQSKYTKEEIKLMSADLPDEMRSKRSVRYSSKTT